MNKTPNTAAFRRWFFEGARKPQPGLYEHQQTHQTHPWWRVMCLTGVDYFSTLGYQPGIAALAAGALSPVATLVLVLVTLFGALPMYRRVAAESPHGDGSISMLERLLQGWTGKFVVLALIGFVATGFVITITLSAADAAKHIVENPLVPAWLHHQLGLTLLLIALLGAIFLVGFKEAIGIAVVLVVAYIGLSAVVIIKGFQLIVAQPTVVSDWLGRINASYATPMAVIGAALLVFPKLALGLSGFETGVVVMPLVKGKADDNPQHPEGRIQNSRKLLTTAALIMSVMLITSAVVTTLLIPAEEFKPGGEANGRALAYLAHEHFGTAFATFYDLSTILILWFAGSSAMAGLLNITPRYLPRYGMAPDWARAVRPLVLLFTLVCFVVTLLFKADVDAQAAAYATGVLALMTSAAIAVTLSALHQGGRMATLGFGLIALVFIYTITLTIFESPSGIQIAAIFIVAIIGVSLVSRVLRSTELRVERIELDKEAQDYVAALSSGEVRIIANKRQSGKLAEYADKEKDIRQKTHIPDKDPVIFLEVSVPDASDFSDVVRVHGVDMRDFKILRAQSTSVPNTIAALALYIRDQTGKVPHVYFEWSEKNPIESALRFLFLGEGDTAPVTHEILRQAEPDLSRRPVVHVGG